jgi:alpha-tubulin suppressor-like RCC1 family protein
MKRQAIAKYLAIFVLLCSQVLNIQSPAQAALDVSSQPLSSGNNATCVIRSSDDLYCVGSNTFGQLGNGNTISTSDPQKVLGIANVAQVSVGTTSACAINRAASLYCWGDNSSGQLGIGSVENKVVATLVPTLSNVVQVSVGSNFACALTSSGVVYCWGANDVGQLTNDSKLYSSVPVASLQTPSGVSFISTNGKRICVLSSEVFCWGDFASFVFPNETRTWMPTKLTGSAGATSVSLGGDFGCLQFASSVSCWGANGHGQLGNGTKIQSADLVKVTGITSVTKLATGEHFACAIDANNDSYCWGENGAGQLGITAGVDQVTRIPTGAAKAVAIDAGVNALCSLKLDGAVSCSGDVSSGQSGYLLSSQTPLVNAKASNLTKVSAGSNTTCSINGTGSLSCWGTLVPIIPELLTFTDISVGNSSACAVTTAKDVYCWGSNSSGQLGDNSSRAAVLMVKVASATSKFVHVAVGYRHACAVTSDGLAYCWGDNSKQQLGASGADTKIPKPVPGIGTAATVAVGDYHSCVQQISGAITCWGDNTKKQINSSSITPVAPTDLVLAKTVTSYSLGSYNTCLLDSSKAVQCFGDNSKKQSPGVIAGTYTAISAGANTVCVINTDIKTFCFGAADSAKLGNVSVDTSTPKEIPDLSATALSVGLQHVCAIGVNGALACWGSNASGQLSTSFGFPSAFATPTISVIGTLALGETLTTVITGTEGDTSFAYLWTRATSSAGSYSNLTSQTSQSLVSSGIDLGRFFIVEVKQSKWGISSPSYLSKAVGPVGPAIRLLLTPIPSVSGVNKVSKVLIARPGRWDTGSALSFQWYRGSTSIKGATKINYKLVAADVGKQIWVAVIGNKPGLPKVTKKSQKTVKIIR